jgi:hypothetical protein
MLRAAGLVKSYRAPAGTPIRVLAGVDLTVKGARSRRHRPFGPGQKHAAERARALEDGDGEIWFEDTRVSALRRGAERARPVRRPSFQPFCCFPRSPP